jgi:hypothetical protein
MSKSPIYDRGLMLTLLNIIPQMPDEFTITTLVNRVVSVTDTTMTGRDLANLRERIKRQMEYVATQGDITIEVETNEFECPPMITAYKKQKQ